MKKLLLAILVICPFSAFAAAIAQPVRINIKLMEGDKIVTMLRVITLDGQPAQVEISSEHPYVARTTTQGDVVISTTDTIKEGLFLAITPTIQKNGKIEVAFSVKKLDINSIKTVISGGMQIQIPDVTSSDVSGNAEVSDGEEVSLPFGESKPGIPVAAEYMLRLVATKG